MEQQNSSAGNAKWYSYLGKTASQFLTKLNSFTIWSSHHTPRSYPSELKTCPHKNLQVNVYSSFSHNCPKLDVTKMLFHRWTDKQTTTSTQWNIQFSSVAQSCPTLCDPMNCSTPGFPVHHQLPEFTHTQRPLSRWCHPAISSSVVPFSSCPQPLPASESAIKRNELSSHKKTLEKS